MTFVKQRIEAHLKARPDEDGSHAWVDAKDARDSKGTPYGDHAKVLSLPPGPDVRNQRIVDVPHAKLKPAGEWSDVVFGKDYIEAPMDPTDPRWTNRREAGFYSDVVMYGEESFIERENVKDRS